jgi:hypothetical protein
MNEKFSPDKKGFEKLIEKTKGVASIEDIMRSATNEEYKNLKYEKTETSRTPIEVYEGEIGGHSIRITYSYSPHLTRWRGGFNYDLTIDGIDLSENSGDLEREKDCQSFFEKIESERLK